MVESRAKINTRISLSMTSWLKLQSVQITSQFLVKFLLKPLMEQERKQRKQRKILIFFHHDFKNSLTQQKSVGQKYTFTWIFSTTLQCSGLINLLYKSKGRSCFCRTYFGVNWKTTLPWKKDHWYKYVHRMTQIAATVTSRKNGWESRYQRKWGFPTLSILCSKLLQE